MVEFELLTSHACANCERAKQKIVGLIENAKERHPDLSWREVKVGDDPELAARYGVMSTPAIALGGRVVLTGVPTERQFLRILQEGPKGEAPRAEPNAGRWTKHGAVAVYCASCVAMGIGSALALAAALGIGGIRSVSTPLDGFLNAWGLPLLIASVLALLWAMRRATRWPLTMTGAGGGLTILSMILMGPFSQAIGGGSSSANGNGGMDGMGGGTGGSMGGTPPGTGTGTGMIPDLWVALLFWAGAALLLVGYVWALRQGAIHRVKPPAGSSASPSAAR